MQYPGRLSLNQCPHEVVLSLSKAETSVLQRSDTRQRLAAQGTDLVAMPSAQLAEKVRRETQVYGDIIKRFGIKAS